MECAWDLSATTVISWWIACSAEAVESSKKSVAFVVPIGSAIVCPVTVLFVFVQEAVSNLFELLRILTITIGYLINIKIYGRFI